MRDQYNLAKNVRDQFFSHLKCNPKHPFHDIEIAFQKKNSSPAAGKKYKCFKEKLAFSGPLVSQ